VAHHLGRVLRAQAGQLYELSDGERVWLGRIEKAGRDHVEFVLLEELPTDVAKLEVTLLLAVVKFDAFEWALEKATELGVNRIVPLAAARSEKALLTAAGKRAERWRKILLEASQQSRRVRVPALAMLMKPEAAFRSHAGANKILLSERADTPPLRTILKEAGSKAFLQGLKPMEEGSVTAELPSASLGTGKLRPPKETAFPNEPKEDDASVDATEMSDVRKAALAIGPEGGWTDEELGAAREAGFNEASLGRLILRTETAVIAALASVNYALAEG